MRDYGKVFTSFWTSSSIRGMSEDGRALSMYLLTCPHGTIPGVFRLPDGYACEDLQWTAERVKEGFDELLANGFATRCEATKWVWIAKHLEWNPPENPNQKKAAAKLAAQVPDECCWKPAFVGIHGESLGIEWNKKETVAEPFANPSLTSSSSSSSKQEQKQELLPAGEPSGPVVSSTSKAETALQAACRSTWDAYSLAYADRYGTEPVRNAKVSTQVKQFVQRLGFDESPLVAAFYVGHSNAFYVKKSHDFGSLLASCEGIRTEWATGRMVTATSAQQTDRTQSNFNSANEAIRILEARGTTA